MRSVRAGAAKLSGPGISGYRGRVHETDMVGWDFSRLDGRATATGPPWDFEDVCRAAMAGVGSVLDMGTGGGERLIALLTSGRAR